MPGPRSAGLFHTAFLFTNKSDLAASVYSVARRYPTSFTGSSDHFVSNAFYFNDPEGNGVELYGDTSRDLWDWTNGTVKMCTLHLDSNRFLQENLTEVGAAAGTAAGTNAGTNVGTVAGTGAVAADDKRVGHVHLKVGDIQTAKQFYVDTVGFETTVEYGTQALFVSAGGYHHHLGMNTWQSSGAGARTPALGLGEVSITVPTTDDLGALRDRLTMRGIQLADDGWQLRFNGPWANLVRVSATAVS